DQLRLGLGWLRLWRRNGVERDLEGDDWSFGVERLARARVQLPKPSDNRLWPELEGRRTSRMQERPAAGDDLDRVRVHAEPREKRHRVALGVEDVYEPAAAPIPAFLASLGAAAPHSRSRDELVVFARSKKALPDLEQRDVARAAAGVALDRHDEARNEARAHVGEIGGARGGGGGGSPPRAAQVP